jgi:hypothetical protein
MLAMALTALVLSAYETNTDDNSNNDDAMYELAGRWYNNFYDLAFEITQAGDGYIAESRTSRTTLTYCIIRN